MKPNNYVAVNDENSTMHIRDASSTLCLCGTIPKMLTNCVTLISIHDTGIGIPISKLGGGLERIDCEYCRVIYEHKIREWLDSEIGIQPDYGIIDKLISEFPKLVYDANIKRIDWGLPEIDRGKDVRDFVMETPIRHTDDRLYTVIRRVEMRVSVSHYDSNLIYVAIKSSTYEKMLYD